MTNEQLPQHPPKNNDSFHGSADADAGTGRCTETETEPGTATVPPGGTPTPTNAIHGNTNSPSWTNQDLMALIRAVKFSNPTASIRQVHYEITTHMASHASFEFLSQVSYPQVKKVWKKALVQQREQQHHHHHPPQPQESGMDSSCLSFYTVGDGSVQRLAQHYTTRTSASTDANVHADADALLSSTEDTTTSTTMTSTTSSFVHCFLDIPADTTGMKPYQALINFNNPHDSHVTHVSHEHDSPNDDEHDVVVHDVNNKDTTMEIVKIQVAAAIPGRNMEHTPMLLYNQSRTAKTFIHPPDKKDDGDEPQDGYHIIKKWIQTSGTKGVLANGGQKAYFYAQIMDNPDKNKESSSSSSPPPPRIIRIDVSKLAPLDQKW